MATLNFLHIANDAFMTEGTRSLNIIGIFDRIHANKLPVVLPKFSVVAHVNAMEGPHKISMLVKKSEEVITEAKSEFFGTNHQWIGHFAGMPFQEAGEYLFELSVDGEIVGTKRLSVVQEV